MSVILTIEPENDSDNAEEIPEAVTSINRVIKNLFTNLLLGRTVSEHPNIGDKSFINFTNQINAFRNGLLA